MVVTIDSGEGETTVPLTLAMSTGTEEEAVTSALSTTPDVAPAVEAVGEEKEAETAAKPEASVETAESSMVEPVPEPTPVVVAAVGAVGEEKKAETPESLVPHSTLPRAAGAGDLARVIELLDAGRDINEQDDTGKTALKYAATRGDSMVVTFLLDRGADINLQDHKQRNPLTQAAFHNHPQVVSQLLKRGADINVRCIGGLTPLAIAARRGHEEVVAAILRHLYEEVGDHEERRRVMNIRGQHGYNALMHAAHGGHQAVVSRLLKAGASPRMQTNRRTPADMARAKGYDAVAELIEKRSAGGGQVGGGGSTRGA
jgi:ankyrin repeat protein